MRGRSDKEIEEDISNVRITSLHGEEALRRIRGSSDDTTKKDMPMNRGISFNIRR
jgi:hypothetical protein